MRFIGIMQGRLTPPIDQRIQHFPRDAWAAEFTKASQAGLDGIEWIYDAWGKDGNPLATDYGIGEMTALAARHGIVIRSVCADYFMDYPLVRATPDELRGRQHHLTWLLDRCRQAGITRLVLPFVDQSAMHTDAELQEVVEVLRQTLPTAEAQAVEIHVEASLSPARFAEFLNLLPHPMLRVNYDIGNSASLGFAVRDEFASYGERVGSVHIKDRLLGGGTVPLGTGDADFAGLFACLEHVSYAGDLILQVARGPAGAEVEWARHNRAFVQKFLG